MDSASRLLRLAGTNVLISFVSISLLANLIMLVGPIFMLQVYDRVLPGPLARDALRQPGRGQVLARCVSSQPERQASGFGAG